MGELSKKLYVSYNGQTQAIKLYSDTTGMSAFSYIIVDGQRAYIPLVKEGDNKATKIHVKESNGNQWCVAAYVQITPAYQKLDVSAGQVLTFTVPAGVTKVRYTWGTIPPGSNVMQTTRATYVYAVSKNKTYTLSPNTNLGNLNAARFFPISVEYGEGIESLPINAQGPKWFD